MIEGHGGMLDRVDSISFAAPVFFHMVHYWWAVQAIAPSGHRVEAPEVASMQVPSSVE